MPSGAQLNRWGKNGGILLLPLLTSASTAVGSPLTAYGTTTGPTPNDSGAYISPIGMSKWTFQLIGAGANTAGYTITIYGTTDPAAYASFSAPLNSGTAITGGTDGVTSGIPASSWQVIPGPSDQSGTGAVSNPMISGAATWFTANIPLVAVRAVLTTLTGSPSSSISVVGFAVP